jgi:hypothetical protein
VQFPTLKARNLLRRQVTLPIGLEGDVNILLVAFQQWQQSSIDTWLPFVKKLENAYNGVRYYELPVIRQMNPLSRTFINEGMRAGIPDALARERTITLYLDKIAFRQELNLPHEDEIYVLLVDREGQVLWRMEGTFTAGKGAALAQAVDDVVHTTGAY